MQSMDTINVQTYTMSSLIHQQYDTLLFVAIWAGKQYGEGALL